MRFVKSDFKLSIGMVAEEIALKIFSHNLFLSNDYYSLKLWDGMEEKNAKKIWQEKVDYSNLGMAGKCWL